MPAHEMTFIGMTVWHTGLLVLLAILVLYPVGRILGRLGYSPLWSVLALVPLVNLIGLWVLAVVPWPHGQAPQSIPTGDTRRAGLQA